MPTRWNPTGSTGCRDRFDPSMENFNPAYPDVYAACEEIAPDDLPAEIREHAWPEGYLA